MKCVNYGPRDQLCIRINSEKVKARSTKGKIDKLNLMKLENVFLIKAYVKKIKRQTKDWQKKKKKPI